jgi:hypothetical protein
MVEFAADGIDARREAEFRAHLAACPACAAEWAEIEAADAALAGYPFPARDDAFFERFTAKVNRAIDDLPEPAPAPWRFLLRRPVMAFAGAAACLLVVMLARNVPREASVAVAPAVMAPPAARLAQAPPPAEPSVPAPKVETSPPPVATPPVAVPAPSSPPHAEAPVTAPRHPLMDAAPRHTPVAKPPVRMAARPAEKTPDKLAEKPIRIAAALPPAPLPSFGDRAALAASVGVAKAAAGETVLEPEAAPDVQAGAEKTFAVRAAALPEPPDKRVGSGELRVVPAVIECEKIAAASAAPAAASVAAPTGGTLR